ncbi:hypothetical protein A2U01_0049838, partial [Trifolium medium]|nr:hypothetical protein [Trifolium medium]
MLLMILALGGRDVGKNGGWQGREKIHVSKGEGVINVSGESRGEDVGRKAVVVVREKEAEGEGVRVGDMVLNVGAVTRRKCEGGLLKTGTNQNRGVEGTMGEKVVEERGHFVQEVPGKKL